MRKRALRKFPARCIVYEKTAGAGERRPYVVRRRAPCRTIERPGHVCVCVGGGNEGRGLKKNGLFRAARRDRPCFRGSRSRADDEVTAVVSRWRQTVQRYARVKRTYGEGNARDHYYYYYYNNILSVACFPGE